MQYAGLNKEAARLEAVNALGDGATDAQIKDAIAASDARFDAEQRYRDRKAALDADAQRKAKVQRDDDLAQLDRQLKAGDVTFEQSQQRRAQIAADYSKAIADANSQAVVTPQQQLAGQVDPVQQLANENAQKLALIKEYTAQRVITEEQGLALMNAANTEYEAQRTAAQWQLLSQQGLGYDMLTSAVDAFAGNASNALTGLLTGSMSAEDAMRSLGSTMLNSVVNSLVQVGVEALKNFIIAQTIGAAGQTAAAAAATAGGAAALAAWTPAAIAASIATMGAASGTGLAAYQTAQAGGLAMSVLGGVAGARKNGGPVSAGSMYRVGEGGMAELYQASNGSQYMIPGDNGKVISNKDMQSGASNVIINITNVGTPQEVVDQQSTRGVTGQEVIEIIMADARNSGPASRALANKMGTKLRPNGE